MTRVRSLSPIVAAIAVTLAWTAVADAQTSAQINVCAAHKTEVSGQYMDAVIDCQTRVARQGDGADAKCVMQAARKMTEAFAAIERDGGCATVNDAPAVIARINASVTDLVAMLDPANSTQCRKHQLKAIGKEAERQARCVADAVARGVGYSVDAECQGDASERFLAEFERANGCGVITDAAAIDAAIRAAANLARNVIKPPVSACEPIEITAIHGANFIGNSRLAKIENGNVACIHIDTAATESCVFTIVPGRQSGEWLESPEGNFALVGQAIALDGRPGGEYLIAARVSDSSPTACVEPAGMDTLGQVMEGFELAPNCTIEEPGTDYNALSAQFPYWMALINYADREVCSSNNPATNYHPDFAGLVRSFPASGTGPDDTFCYFGYGAALNDLNGTERDIHGNYLSENAYCHFMNIGGYEVPAAKRPATFSFPVPGVNTRSPILWRPMNPHVTIANGGAAPPVVQLFDDQHAFQAATGATNATGPLPDIGQVGASVTIGSVTFSLAVGGDTMAVGAAGTPAAPDWYPELPGNDIALGWENLQVQFATPIYALGFEFAEPDLTMPPFGGTPEDTTFVLVMYRGSAEVGRTTFNARDDVAAFVGVWSSRAFDRVTIIDQSGNDDDEFFGQFYVGLTPKP